MSQTTQVLSSNIRQPLDVLQQEQLLVGFLGDIFWVFLFWLFVFLLPASSQKFQKYTF